MTALFGVAQQKSRSSYSPADVHKSSSHRYMPTAPPVYRQFSTVRIFADDLSAVCLVTA